MFLFNSGLQKSFTASLSLLFLSLFVAHAAVARPGDLDTSFGNGGIATARIGKNSADFAYATALQSDGKIIVAGANTSGIRTNFIVARINPDGSLDTSFGANGTAVKRVNDSINYATSVIIQPDGKIVAGGFSLHGTTYYNNFTLVRFNADGTIDESFGTSGVVQTVFPDAQRTWINALAIQADGKIIAAGHSYGGNVNNTLAIAVARYNADGSLDTSFDGDGRRLLFFGTSNANRANSVVVQPDGKIILGGNGLGGSSVQFAIARLNPDGSYDTSFDGDGKLTTAVGTTGSVINTLLLQTNGKITAVGSRSNGGANDIAVARYNADGSLDTSFDTDGIATADIGNDTITGAAMQADGKIVAGGYASSGTSVANRDFISVRFNADGSLDTTFDGDGKVLTQVTPTEDIANGMLLQPDGRIVLTGYGLVTNYDISVVRYNTDGSLDSSFAGDGIAFIESGSSGDLAYASAVQPDGKIVAAGHRYNGLYNEMAVTRFNQNGSHDTTFGNGGIVSMALDGAARAEDVIVQPDGKILVAGYGIVFDNNAFIIIRLNADGSFDSTFGNGGTLALSVGAGADYFADLALQPDGKIVAAGYCAGEQGFEVCVARVLTNGALDTSFGSDGKVVTIDSANNDQTTSVALQADGKIVVAGTGYNSVTGLQRFLVSRYNTDGTLDTNFAGGSGKTYTVFYPNVSSSSGGSAANAVKIQTDGKIVAAGYTSTEGSHAGHYALARYNTDGTLDNTFDGDGKVTTIVRDIDVGFCQIYDLDIQQNGKIVVAGSAMSTTFVGSVFRYNADGSLDTSFGNGGKVLTQIGTRFNEFYGMTIQPDGKIIAAGYSSNGADDDFTIARYQGDAAVPAHRSVFDFDGDGKTDISIFRPSGGEWWINRSSNSTGYALQFGSSSDKLTPADFTGDGKTDVAFFRPATGEWFVMRSEDNSFYSFPFGTSGDIPAPADFDGDNKADAAVFRPSDATWYIRRSSDGGTIIQQFGQNGDVPVAADYDGDGKADIAIYRVASGQWWIQRSTAGLIAFQFGNSTDKPVQGDYTGDGKADVALFRPQTGEWFVLRSENQSYYSFPFGTNGDTPAPGDYDGDGKFDATVFRSSANTWYSQRTTAGTLIQSFGQNGDIPVPSAFVP